MRYTKRERKKDTSQKQRQSLSTVKKNKMKMTRLLFHHMFRIERTRVHAYVCVLLREKEGKKERDRMLDVYL